MNHKKEIEKFKNKIKALRSEIEENKKKHSLNIEDVIEKKKYFSCIHCNTRFESEKVSGLLGAFEKGNWGYSRCPVCGKVMFTTQKRLENFQNKELELDSLILRRKVIQEEYLESVKSKLSTVKHTIERQDGCFQVKTWEYDNYSDSFEIMFRNNDYAYHESYTPHDTLDKDDLKSILTKTVKSNFGSDVEVDLNYHEKCWFSLHIKI